MRFAFLIVPFDAVALIAAGAAIVIALTGGGSLTLMGHVIRAHSVGNPLLFLAVWGLLRYRFIHVPLLLIPTLSLERLPAHSLRAIGWCERALRTVSRRGALAIVCGVAASITAVKLALVLGHPGFFSGDDVEVHEMTLNALFGEAWPIWSLRGAFYPMSMIYPAQRLAWTAGFTDPAHLVIAGRLVVVALSTIAILVLFRTARERFGVPVALVGSVLLATSSMYVTFGATELPRPIAALFVLVAYSSLSRPPRASAAVLAGVSLGVAACMRFSEVVFLLPALVHLAAERRWRDGVWLIVAFIAVAGAVQFISDDWYWGRPFHSLRAIVDFTLVEQLSSRGYDSWWYYARDVASWSDLLVVALAIGATRRNRILALWTWLPIILLSTLPHKEPRYLIPILPLLSLLAAQGFMDVLPALRSSQHARAGALALGLVAAVAFRTVDQTSKYHVVRSDREVRFARQLGPTLSSAPVVAEQAWRFGGRLYLGHGRTVTDVGVHDLEPGVIVATVERTSPGLILVSHRTCAAVECVSSLNALGFVATENRGLEDIGYRLFRPSGDVP